MWYKLAQNSKWATYEQAKQYAIINFITTKQQWIKAIKPPNMPMYPDRVYPNWQGWELFLAPYVDTQTQRFPQSLPQIKTDFRTLKQFYGELPSSQPILVPYEEAQEWARQNNIQTYTQWFQTPKPANIPANPADVYKNNKWIDWYTFLSKKKIKILPYEKAKQLVQKKQIKNLHMYYDYKKKNPISGLPNKPQTYYKGLYSYLDFFGVPFSRATIVLPYEQAKEIIQQNNIKHPKEYDQFVKTHPTLNLPLNPDYAYKNLYSYEDFYGIPSRQPIRTKTNSTQVKNWILQNNIQNWEQYLHNKPTDFPDELPQYLRDFFVQARSFNWYKYSQSKVLIVMMGLPGSGKSSLAEQLGKGGVVFSTDDFFIENGKYNFNPKLLGKNHQQNLDRTIKAMQQGISPIVVDNTNLTAGEKKPYVLAGQKYGYTIEFKEPQTEWAWDASELAKRNTHGVPEDKIKQMIDRYDSNTDIDYIVNSKAPWE